VRSIRHAFTIDVEEWFQAVPATPETRRGLASRVEAPMDLLLSMLDDADARGTFYWLGPVAEQHPDLVRRTAASGHEIGCHGWSHDLIYSLSPETFRAETDRATKLLADLVGKPVVSYRAAYFSVTRESMWALDVLAELGYTTDSSIFPVQNWRYGIPDFETRPVTLETKAGPIREFPISVRPFRGKNLPVSGGAYFRIYPYAVTRSNFRFLEESGQPGVFYLHPWELDPDHPRVRFDWRAWTTHYINLRSTVPKLRKLLRDFRFAPMNEVLDGNHS
jgi:polysaccharide deacetylase family protein (PEP-CTERM system associated)